MAHLHSSNIVPLAGTLLQPLITVSFTSPNNPSAIPPFRYPYVTLPTPPFLTYLSSPRCNSNFGDSSALRVRNFEAWTSKTVPSLAKDLSKDNFGSIVRIATRVAEIITESKYKTSKVDKRPTEWRVFDRPIFADYIGSDTELCLWCLELISVYFESDLWTRLLTGGETCE